MAVLGFDTSNYTTSVAVYRADGSGRNEGMLLTVPEGGRGLRQRDALFQHVKRLPDRMAALDEAGWLKDLEAVGASTAPRSVEGSYMPCFLAGVSQAQGIARTLHIPFFGCSHQEGHLASACWSAGRLELLDQPFLAWHLSGGTTELLLVRPEGSGVWASCIGGTNDISAGQLIDRTGQRLGLAFPAGRELDKLTEASRMEKGFRVRLEGLTFSLSGVENKVMERCAQGWPPEDVARYVLLTIGSAVRRATDAALEQYPGFPVLCSGGVASNRLLRGMMGDAIFAEPRFSTDNAMGVAILAERRLRRDKE